MLFVLLGFSLCEATKLCLQSDSANKCPDGIATASTFTSAEELLKKVVNGGEYFIYTDATFELSQEQLLTVVEIDSIKETIEVTSKISTSASHPGISLTGITLSVTKATSAKLLEGESDSSTDPKITFEKATLGTNGSFKPSSLVFIKNLFCTTIKEAKGVISFMAVSEAKININGKDVIDKVTGAGKGIKFTKDADDLDITEGGPATTIVSIITTSADFTLVSQMGELEVSADVTLVYGNTGEAIITLKEEGLAKSPKPIITIETYYMFDSSFTENGKTMCVLNTDFLVDADGNRKIPASPAYCLDKSSKRVTTCPTNATLLWNAKEIASAKNGESLVTIYLSGFDVEDNGLSLNLNDYSEKEILFTGSVPDKQQIISTTLVKKDESFTGNFKFESISLVTTVPSGSTDASIGFKNLLVTNSKVSATETVVKAPESGSGDSSAPSGSSSRKLRATVEMKVNSEELTSDAASFKNFKAQKPSKSFSVANPKSLVFSGDGKTVTIDSVNFTDESIPVPFNIVALPGQELKDVILKIDSDNGSPGKALPFAFDVKEGSNLSVKYSGDWSSNTIVVNVAAGSTFAGNKASESDKSPVMEKQGSGTATLDDKVLVSVTESASPKGGLSGGAIAGIVVACVVAVAAIAITAFIVRRKKSKVAN